MFKDPRYIQNIFSLFFPRQPTIRRKANDFEDRLANLYFQPQIIPVPDDLDPQVPRMIFGSEHGFSQIIISQVNIKLNVSYSPDWQVDIDKGRQYLLERVPKLFDLVAILEDSTVNFSGLSTKVRLATQQNDQSILSHIAKKILVNQDVSSLHDLQIKQTNVLSDRFFSNIVIGNYRVWTIPDSVTSVPHLHRNQVVERGIEINGDFNDRFAYNEGRQYQTGSIVAQEIIQQGLDEMHRVISEVISDVNKE